MAPFSEVEHRHGNSVAIFESAGVNKSNIYFTMHKRQAPINTISLSKAPKTQQIAVTDINDKLVECFYSTKRVFTLAFAII